MGKVSESIFTGKTLIVPLADVQHIEKQENGGLIVVTRHSRWDADNDFWANNIYVEAREATAFISAFCQYRHELEFNTLADLTAA